MVQSSESTICTELPDLLSIDNKWCWTKTRKRVKDLNNPNNRERIVLSVVVRKETQRE